MPNDVYALEVYFNSALLYDSQHDPLETPVAKHGFGAPPSGWGQNGQGYKAWRSEWRSFFAASSTPGGLPYLNNVGQRILPVDPNLAQGSDLLIRVWDVQTQQSTLSQVTVQVICTTPNPSGGNQPPFSSYQWGDGNSGNFPILLPPEQYVTLTSPAGFSLAPTDPAVACNSYTTQTMSPFRVLHLTFLEALPAQTHVDIALYFTLINNAFAPLPCYKDPEMEFGN